MLKFFTDILLYSGGSFIGRIITFFLLPLTTSYLTPSDYGIIGILTLVPVFANGIFSLGFHTSLGRVFSAEIDPYKKEGVIWTAFLALVANSILWTSLALIFSPQLSVILLGSDHYRYLVDITFLGVGICTVRMAFEYYLRASGKARLVFSLNVLDVLFSVTTMLLAVVYLKRGAQGYMEAFALSQTINLVIMLIVITPQLHFSIQWQPMRELILLGAPCITGYWGYCVLQGISRYILQVMTTEEEVGLYFLGSNLGRVIELPLWGFMSAWVPLFNSYLHKPTEAPRAFSRIMTYYVLGMSFFAAAFFCFARPVAHTLMQPPFHEVWKVIGISAVAQALWGVYAITYPPLVFHKRTGLQSCLELGAGAWCIVANIILVPFFLMQGAAVATLLGFLGLVVASLVVNQKLLHVSYETDRLGKIVLFLALTAAVSFLPISHALFYNSLMLLVFLAYIAYGWFAILTEQERGDITHTIQQKLSPAKGDYASKI